jgi:hypothetical protein
MSSNPMPQRDGDLRAHWMAEVRRWVEGRHDLDSVDVSVKALRELLSALASPQEAQPLSQQIEAFRREVQDKLAVTFHVACSSNGNGYKARVVKQCEDFLVEQFESAISPDAGQQVISRERTEEQVHTRVVGVPEGAHGDLPRHTTR